jgi:hypothetical protein
MLVLLAAKYPSGRGGYSPGGILVKRWDGLAGWAKGLEGGYGSTSTSKILVEFGSRCFVKATRPEVLVFSMVVTPKNEICQKVVDGVSRTGIMGFTKN